ncbi:PD-(D/E)XK nuclease family protein [Flavobacterium sp. ALJ2]|uniref:PD-(D/E)XK nuclease family protein n=1 Tax=Flavobacterium sp. ALJ2 TaxID=2786960 RepID=UPI00189FEC86|nr:PD-(D/E)XK nuclease family protein [Flavobacterium sp. ALJ2]MBF7091401.1 PD-(D/E)XK nuclease family protein [Flavobacterium sp. ALJ2]
MLNNLYKLYNNNNLKKPLEDFTTESFAGILRYDYQLLNDFCVKFLNLEEEKFTIKTQIKYSLKNDINCIVDVVIESENQICFIENKVDSKEGHRQLERYSEVLNIFTKENKKTYLFYCTKNFEEKLITEHNFKHIRWFQIAKFIGTYSKNSPIEQDFLKFLKSKKMTQNLTITTKDMLVIENLFETIDLINGHLERVKPLFIQTFNKGSNRINDGFSTTQILRHKRLIYHFKDIIGKADGWSEIKYGFQLNNLNIYCGIWIDKKNTEYINFRNHILNNNYNFKILDKPNGFAIELNQSLNIYVNEINGDEKILDWFRDSFSKLFQVLTDTNQLDWKINIFSDASISTENN